MAHLNLVMIHPFRDGNGRMARALQTMVLAQDQVLEPTFSSIEEWLGHNTDDYYAVLAATGGGSWHPERDARLWVQFNLRAHHMQAQTLQRRFAEAERLVALIDSLVADHALPERACRRPVRRPPRSPRDAADLREASGGRGAHGDPRLGRLVELGLLQPHGADPSALLHRRRASPGTDPGASPATGASAGSVPQPHGRDPRDRRTCPSLSPPQGRLRARASWIPDRRRRREASPVDPAAVSGWHENDASDRVSAIVTPRKPRWAHWESNPEPADLKVRCSAS